MEKEVDTIEQAAEKHSTKAVGSTNSVNYNGDFIYAMKIRAKRSFIAGANHIKASHVPIEEVERIFESQSAGLEKSQKIFSEAAPNRTNPFDALISNNRSLLNKIRNLIKFQLK